MKVRRRRLSGRPLLVATSAGVALTITSCADSTSGNLVAPPQVQLCVEVVPDEATVSVDGVEWTDERCEDVWEGLHTVDAVAEGYEDYSEEVMVDSPTTHEVTMVEESGD